MSLDGCLSIACTSYPPDSIQSHSDNPQTPLRHFPDNLQTFRGTWERRNQLIKITLIGFMSINITLYPHPILIDLGLSGMCRRVSERCLEDVWITLDTAWMVIMPNQLLKLQCRNIEYCFNRLVPFLSITLYWPLSFLFGGVCRMSGRFLAPQGALGGVMF